VDLVVHKLNLVQRRPDLIWRHGGVIQEFDELVKSALEIYVVLPERVVGINQQMLSLEIVGLH
jgi:hypothetical protein